MEHSKDAVHPFMIEYHTMAQIIPKARVDCNDVNIFDKESHTQECQNSLSTSLWGLSQDRSGGTKEPVELRPLLSFVPPPTSH